MRKINRVLAGLGLALAAGAITVSPAEAACSVRGNWCSYPYWAANAFEAPRDRVSEGAIYGGTRYDRPAPRKRYAYDRSRK